MCSTLHPRCQDCDVLLTGDNTYRRWSKRCKKCQVEYQIRMREKRKGQKGHSTLVVKRSEKLRLVYNPRRQLVDIFAPLCTGGLDALEFWAIVFGKEHTIKETTKRYQLRVPHVSTADWNECTADLEEVE